MLETERLILRLPRDEDLDRWAEFGADEDAARHLGGPKERSAVWREVAVMAGSFALKGFGMFSVVERESGRWVGRIGPWCPPGWPGTEVGWGLHPEAQGKGYGAEAAAASIDWAFDELGWSEVIHCISPANEPSQRLAARLGSRLRGPGRLPAPYESAEIEIWGQTREEWRG